MQFIVKRISKDTSKKIRDIGFDPGYVKQGAKKHEFLSFQIFPLKPQQATILKQCALSLGTDCAVHRHVIDFKMPQSEAVLSGSVSELEKIALKLYMQPFSLPSLAKEIERQISIHTASQKMPKVMGILNLTEDSFSDGGECPTVDMALRKARALVVMGADIIDIGAESTRPGAAPVDVELEISTVVPVISALKKEFQGIELSIDTRNSKTAKAAILAGIDIVNDVSGFEWDGEILKVTASSGKKYVLMHTRGIPETMEQLCQYENVVDEVYFELYNKMQEVIKAGVKRENIIIDPGFGFAKNQEQNVALLAHIREFKSLGAQVLVGASRKRFLAPYSDGTTPKERDDATMLASFWAAQNGVDIVRVHNVELTKNAINLAQALV